MAVKERRERERADRHRRIVAVARELAEDQGWDAVTTRRLADRIEYSQPVLYGHFPGGKDEIVGAVALEGFAELAAALRTAVDAAGPDDAVGALASAYLAFAAEHPEVYRAMFDLAALPFGRDDTPAPLREGFTVVRDVLAPAAPGDPGHYAEVGWATLHGLATLARAGRLPPEGAAERLALAVGLLGQDTATVRDRQTP
ncbi:TetR/AcrR family transcriptional regulator [Actinomycetospora sp. TBRC 11914]|uniref:TetR/AcrR family transcriptional regulator n=1 Tax=Actinomycetospora sp. TBRC 11914 TaxID=2729387 RepID=UPI00145D6D02|nr:TetR/AcrR family transcriptional regulator [Actinomycetospora sp. TBRC 11914]NMO89913.1 TetR/AcrR family transcriptional regulator [Actinomycetospora sp. TBRC 11914]